MGNPVITFPKRVKTGWVNIKVGSVNRFAARWAHVLGKMFILLAGKREGWGGGNVKGTLRVMTAGLLSVTGLCTALLFACAGGNAVHAFWQQQPAAEATKPPEGALSGMVIAIDAGHGGYDGGAVGRVSGVPEKGLNLDVAQKLREILENQGARIVMTRTDDYALCDENPTIRKKLQDMQRRATIITDGGAQMVLSIHMNEYAGRSQSGPQVFYREGCPAGRLLAGTVQEAMNEQLAPQRERAALGGDYYILTLGVPSVLVECGFLSNAKEEAKLLDEGYRERVAQAVAAGVLAWQALGQEKPEPLPAVDRSGEPHDET